MAPEENNRYVVRITLDMIYDKMCALDNKVNHLMSVSSNLVEDFKDHETRLRKAESQLAPVMALLAMGTSIVSPVIVFFLTRG